MVNKEFEYCYFPRFFDADFAHHCFEVLARDIDWKQYPIKLFGKTHLQPRLVHWQGNEPYAYSGTHLQAAPYHSLVEEIKRKVEGELHESFNGVLLNYYRNGLDSMGWHSDNEKSLGQNPLVVSVSLTPKGEETSRKFVMRHKKNKTVRHSLELYSGDLLVLERGNQELFEHCAPKQPKVISGRINLTFRQIVPSLGQS